jgi:hypothetical protein
MVNIPSRLQPPDGEPMPEIMDAKSPEWTTGFLLGNHSSPHHSPERADKIPVRLATPRRNLPLRDGNRMPCCSPATNASDASPAGVTKSRVRGRLVLVLKSVLCLRAMSMSDAVSWTASAPHAGLIEQPKHLGHRRGHSTKDRLKIRLAWWLDRFPAFTKDNAPIIKPYRIFISPSPRHAYGHEARKSGKISSDGCVRRSPGSQADVFANPRRVDFRDTEIAEHFIELSNASQVAPHDGGLDRFWKNLSGPF